MHLSIDASVHICAILSENLFCLLHDAVAETFRSDHLHTGAMLQDLHRNFRKVSYRKTQLKRPVVQHRLLLILVPDLILSPFCFFRGKPEGHLASVLALVKTKGGIEIALKAEVVPGDKRDRQDSKIPYASDIEITKSSSQMAVAGKVPCAHVVKQVVGSTSLIVCCPLAGEQ